MMPKNESIKVLLGHRAVKAWSDLHPECPEPEGIEILTAGDTSAVCKLGGVGVRGSAVIAKRCLRLTAMIERTIYTEILPLLPMPCLRCYGSVREEEGQFWWLFLEDAGGDEYSPDLEEHRALAARWLGTIHTSAVSVAAVARLPYRGPDHYLEHLRMARDKIRRNLTNPLLTGEDLVVLKSILSQCDVLEKHWRQVQRFSSRMPTTLVHGDFARQNLRVRFGQEGMCLFPVDWENAGSGVPAADLAQSAGAYPDITAYWTVVRRSWAHLDGQSIQQLAHVGTIYRLLAAISWASESLRTHWVEDAMEEMRLYEASLADSIRAAEWGG